MARCISHAQRSAKFNEFVILVLSMNQSVIRPPNATDDDDDSSATSNSLTVFHFLPEELLSERTLTILYKLRFIAVSLGSR